MKRIKTAHWLALIFVVIMYGLGFLQIFGVIHIPGITIGNQKHTQTTEIIYAPSYNTLKEEIETVQADIDSLRSEVSEAESKLRLIMQRFIILIEEVE
ncbi:MAG: hypothetical protein ISR78_04670 [Spirochaetia bacterium]|nr:hypothetical protein [Spirochaetia bacterium]